MQIGTDYAPNARKQLSQAATAVQTVGIQTILYIFNVRCYIEHLSKIFVGMCNTKYCFPDNILTLTHRVTLSRDLWWNETKLKNGTAHNRHQCRKIAVLSCHIFLINSSIEKIYTTFIN